MSPGDTPACSATSEILVSASPRSVMTRAAASRISWLRSLVDFGRTALTISRFLGVERRTGGGPFRRWLNPDSAPLYRPEQRCQHGGPGAELDRPFKRRHDGAVPAPRSASWRTCTTPSSSVADTTVW